jgi:cation-transporting ATPase E
MAATENRGTIRSLKRDLAMQQARQQLGDIRNLEYKLNGLSASQVLQRQQLGLTNSQQFEASRSLVNIIRANVFTLFNGIVGGSFLVLLILGQWKDALFGITVVVNVLIGVGQEFRSKRALDKLALLNAPMARVRRNGEIAQIKISDVVLDDLLELRAGDQLVADALVIDANLLEADESLLTGEADPVEKTSHDSLLSGSCIVAGRGAARVVKVGSETYASKITLEARRFSLVNSELRNALRTVIFWISIALLPIVAIVVWGQIQALGGWHAVASGQSTVAVLVSSIASIVSMVPQGLVLITSVAFALAAIKLAGRNVLIQELPAVESLARVDVICFDKTGTLTQGEVEFGSAIELAANQPSKIEWQDALAHFGADPDANATVRCLRELFAVRHDLAVASQVPFSSLRKWSAFSFENAGAKTEHWLLGAPEMLLLDHSDSHLETLAKAQSLASLGHRVLVLASSDSAAALTDQIPDRLVPRVLITIDEAIRPDAIDTLSYFREQGVSIRVISGDNPSTVAAVAKQAGIVDFGIDEGAIAVDGRNLPTDPTELAKLLETHFVFGRVTPEQKRNMVIALQSMGHVVAMTGDGVNDALALKRADLGIAMGSGSAATKAVARIILLDGKFSSLPGVVAEGRKVIANIERITRLFLTKTTWAMTLAITFGLLLWRFPYLPRQLSALDGFTIGLPSFALALLPNKQRYLPGFLGRTLRFTIPSGLIIGGAVIWLAAMLQGETVLPVAQTSVSLLLSVAGLWVIATLSRPFDKWRIAIVVSSYLLFALVFCIPFVAAFFGFVWLSPQQLIEPLGISLIACFGIEIAHRWANRNR